jgi:hypothetical protein
MKVDTPERELSSEETMLTISALANPPEGRQKFRPQQAAVQQFDPPSTSSPMLRG